MMAPYLDRLPTGWHVVTVCRAAARTWDWVALVIDAPPRSGPPAQDLDP
jgi:hypothetical protein